MIEAYRVNKYHPKQMHYISLLLALIMSNAGLAGNFNPPSLDGFNLHNQRDSDGDGDGANETQIMQYLNAAGDSIVSMTTRGRLWAWSINTRGNESGEKNFVIRDSNCDGIFDEVYSLDDQFHVPACLR